MHLKIYFISFELETNRAVQRHSGQWAVKHNSPGKAREQFWNMEWILIMLLFYFSLEQRVINSERQSCLGPVRLPRDKGTLLWQCQLCNKRLCVTYSMRRDTLVQFCLTMRINDSDENHLGNQSHNFFNEWKWPWLVWRCQCEYCTCILYHAKH